MKRGKKRTRDFEAIFKKIPVNYGQVVRRNGNGPRTHGDPKDVTDEYQRELLINYFNGACVTCSEKADECLVLIRLGETKKGKNCCIVISKKEVGNWRGLEPRIKQILGQ